MNYLKLGLTSGRGIRYATEEERKAARKASIRKWRRTPDGRAQMSRNNRRAALKRVGADELLYAELFKRQGGRCAICRTKKPNERATVKHFSVDHCHKTKKVRGLLCNRCNTLLGKVYDDPAILLSAASYLRAAVTG